MGIFSVDTAAKFIYKYIFFESDETSIECRLCGKIFNDHIIILKHLEDHQMEKTWFISQPEEGTSVMQSSNQDVIYILPKKEDSALQFLQFNTDEV